MQNIEKIQQMTVGDWVNQMAEDEHLIPQLCFMCVGCEECEEKCIKGVADWLESEVE